MSAISAGIPQTAAGRYLAAGHRVCSRLYLDAVVPFGRWRQRDLHCVSCSASLLSNSVLWLGLGVLGRSQRTSRLLLVDVCPGSQQCHRYRQLYGLCSRVLQFGETVGIILIAAGTTHNVLSDGLPDSRAWQAWRASSYPYRLRTRAATDDCAWYPDAAQRHGVHVCLDFHYHYRRAGGAARASLPSSHTPGGIRYALIAASLSTALYRTLPRCLGLRQRPGISRGVMVSSS